MNRNWWGQVPEKALPITLSDCPATVCQALGGQVEDATLRPQQIHTGPLHVLGTTSPMRLSRDVSLNPAKLRAVGARTEGKPRLWELKLPDQAPGKRSLSQMPKLWKEGEVGLNVNSATFDKSQANLF